MSQKPVTPGASATDSERGIERRTLMKGAAWGAPVVAVAVSSPTAAASGEIEEGDDYTQLTYYIDNTTHTLVIMNDANATTSFVASLWTDTDIFLAPSYPNGPLAFNGSTGENLQDRTRRKTVRRTQLTLNILPGESAVIPITSTTPSVRLDGDGPYTTNLQILLLSTNAPGTANAIAAIGSTTLLISGDSNAQPFA